MRYQYGIEVTLQFLIYFSREIDLILKDTENVIV